MKTKLEKLFNIADKTIVVTGACGYIGSYIVETMLEFGAHVVMLSHSDSLHTQVNTYKNKFGQNKVHGFYIDFYNINESKKVLEEISYNINVDVLINNAYDLSKKTGFNTTDGLLENSKYDHWRYSFESGIYWAVLTTQIFGKYFKQQKNGSIINISSMYGSVSPNPDLYDNTDKFNPPTYSVNKAGLNAFTRYVASFWGKYNIRCNTISPGPLPNIETKTFNGIDSNDKFLNKLKEKTVLKRLGHPKDLQGLMVYLASDASSFITGQDVIVDGGWTIT